MTTKVSIISQAFILLGKAPINDIVTGNPVVSAASTTYDLIFSSALNDGTPWRFASTITELNRISGTSIDDNFLYVYQLPSTMLRLIRVMNNGVETTDFNIYDNKLYANDTSLKAEYIFLPDVSNIPSYFEKLIVFELTASIAMLVTQNANIAQMWASKAASQLSIARSVDAKSVPCHVIPGGVIYNSHFHGYDLQFPRG